MKQGGFRSNSTRVFVFVLICWLAGGIAFAQQSPTGTTSDDSLLKSVAKKSRRVQAEPTEEDISQYEEATKRFSEHGKSFYEGIQNRIQNEYDRKKLELEERYDREVELLETKEIDAILATIEQIRKFIKRYPDEPKFTPDALFRLAELYYLKSKKEYDIDRQGAIARYEQSLRDYDKALEDYDRAMNKWFDEGGKGPEPKPPAEPAPPGPDFTKSLALYDLIIKKFSDYRYIDVVFYLKAFAHQEREETEQVRLAMKALIKARPDSRYVGEANLRIGEAYFTDFQYDEALKYFKLARKIDDAELRDQVLYKLASAYFIIGDYPNAIKTFGELNDYSEIMLQDPEYLRHSYFREESIKYIAYCYQQSTGYWKKAGVRSAVRYFDKLGPKPWAGEVFKALGDYFKNTTRWDDAIASYQQAIKRDPWNPGNPQIQDQVIQMYFQKSDEKGQARERQLLAEQYSPSSEWAKNNVMNPEAVQAARELVQESLKNSAMYQHSLAQTTRAQAKETTDEGEAQRLMDEANGLYLKAASLYYDYLVNYPNDTDYYELRYLMADAYFYAGKYREAIREYKVVRDSKLSREHFEDAVFGILMGYDNLIAMKSKTGQLEATKEEEEQASKDVREGKITETPFNEDEQGYIDAADYYALHGKPGQDKHIDEFAYNTAFMYFEHKKLEEARSRFIQFVEKFPNSPRAGDAARKIVDTYILVRDWVKVQEWSTKLSELALGEGDEKRARVRGEMQKVLSLAIAKNAQVLQEQGKYEEAAEAYLRVVDRQKDDKEIAAAALYNAAIMYAKANSPAKAMELYKRMVKEFPDAPYSATAQFNLADAAYSSYNLDEAAVAFQKLYTKYPVKADDPDRETNLKRNCNARYLHAELMEFNHDYSKAAKLYETYVGKCGDVMEDGAEVLLKAAKLYSRVGDTRRTDQIYKKFVSKYSKDKKQQRWVVDAYRRMGDMYWKRKKTTDAKKYYSKAIEFFHDHHQLAVDPLANEAAAAAEWVFLEQEFEKFKAYKIRAKRQDKLMEEFETKSKMALEMVDRYKAIFQYKSPEHILAAKYRSGLCLELYGNALFDAPVPRDVERMGDEAIFIYQDLLNEKTRPIYNSATQQYMATLEEGQRAKLFDSMWMKRLIEALNRPNLQEFVTGEFKARKQEKSAFRETVMVPLRMDDGREKAPVSKPEEEPGAEPSEPTEAESVDSGAVEGGEVAAASDSRG